MRIKEIYNLAKFQLFPICRSITGDGVRKTLKLMKKKIPTLKICEIKSGTQAFDWKVPSEWNIKSAFVEDKFGKKIIDFKINNLHIVNYSKPFKKKIKKTILLNHLFSLPKQPNAIPYVTSYYKKTWGFCVTDIFKKKIINNYKSSDLFSVRIDSSFDKKGSLTYGELILKGNSKKEILISTYICHPSMANNELSGPIVSMCLINYFKKIKNLKKTIRFIFIPETIGSIVYLSKHLNHLKKNVIGGYNLSCIGDEKGYSFMTSKYGNTPSDKAIVKAFKTLKIKFKKYSFLERGSDERQYNSPGIDLPIASIFRTKYGKYPEYHTSLDDFKVVTLKGVTGGYNLAKSAINFILDMTIPTNNYLCEPHLSKKGLYPTTSIKRNLPETRNLLNFLQYADGRNDLLDISRMIKISYSKTLKIYKILKNNNVIS